MDQETFTRDPVPWFDEEDYQHLDIPRQIHWEDIEAKGLCPKDPREKWKSTYQEGIVLQDMYMRWCQDFERCLFKLILKLPWANMSKADLLHTIKVPNEYPTKEDLLIIHEPIEALEDHYHGLIFMQWQRWTHQAIDVYEEISSRMEKRESKAQTIFNWDKCEAVDHGLDLEERCDYDYKSVVHEVNVAKKRQDDDLVSGLAGLTMADIADVSERQLLMNIQSLLPSPIKLLDGDAEVDYGLANQVQDVWLGGEI